VRISAVGKKEKKVRIYSALEVADICGVVNQTAINWIKNGFLKAFTTPGGQYRVYGEDLLAFLSSRGMRIPDDLIGRERPSGAGQPEWSRILIVDDDQNINALVKRHLAKSMTGSVILQAFDGYEAGRIISEKRPGVIVLDVNLPGIDGFKLCRRIKSDPALGSPLIVAITGLSGEDIEGRILEEGADAFFAKPFDFEALGERIDELVAARRGMEEEE
jgi:CheY-like chemotaxis protein